MVSSSVHRDPPDMQHQRGNGENPQAPPPISPPASASTRPGSVSERARLTKLPKPETALKCPRCESRNTKFCYYNNYNLSQPRHFCKTCRRFWTRGGALRNVPVGGGCRRNKKSERSTRSKSPVTGSSNSGISSTSCTTASTDIICQLPPTEFPFLPPLHHINDYGTGAIGFSFDGAPSPMAAAGGGFPFLSGLEPPAEMYQFQSEGFSQIEGVKFEEDGLNLPKNYFGVPGIDQFWSSGSAWSDLDGFTSSSVSHLL